MDDDSFLKYQVHKGSGTHIAVIKIEIIGINYSEAKKLQLLGCIYINDLNFLDSIICAIILLKEINSNCKI